MTQSWIVDTCVYGMARREVEDRRDGLEICRVAANILNKTVAESRREWSSSVVRFGGGSGQLFIVKKLTYCEME
jgi:hypothetical protein